MLRICRHASERLSLMRAMRCNAVRFARILDGLRAEGTATVLVLWAVSEDIRTLGKASGVPIKELYNLFPKGPAKLAAKIGGIPKPRGCI
jgi:DNA polymerase III delta subunit